MKYALLVYEDEKVYGPEKGEIFAKHMAFQQELGERRIGGAGLKHTTTATTVRTQGGKQTIHDGPFAETKEQLGGFYLIDVPDLDAAITFAKKLPLLQNGSVEIRPVLSGE